MIIFWRKLFFHMLSLLCSYSSFNMEQMHAGIATQAKVDARLKEEGISRYDIGREKFLERSWEWKDEYANLRIPVDNALSLINQAIIVQIHKYFAYCLR